MNEVDSVIGTRESVLSGVEYTCQGPKAQTRSPLVYLKLFQMLIL